MTRWKNNLTAGVAALGMICGSIAPAMAAPRVGKPTAASKLSLSCGLAKANGGECKPPPRSHSGGPIIIWMLMAVAVGGGVAIASSSNNKPKSP